MRFARDISLGFAAGAIGGVVSALIMWFCGEIGLADHYQVRIHPSLSAPWMYEQVVIGGLFGLFFLLPIMQDSYFLRGLAIAAIPAFFTLFVVYPIFQDKGIMGKKLGELTWAAIVFYKATWGLSAGLWLKWSDGR